MGDWNKQAAPNNNLSAETIKTSNLIGNKEGEEHAFSEELSDGGERDQFIKKQLKSKKQ
ncbi:hypothetical protein R4Z10_11110 [Niallia sp. XMNu-256]|uniref:hypothetical protein n=1 Tax=Niallia sp. XMNu-256 TaxID=3082444 RepID=UPI0030D17D02